MSDVRPPSRPPPSQSEPAEEPTGTAAPTPPAQRPPSQVPPTEAETPQAETPQAETPRSRRRWLVSVIAGVIVLAVGVSALVLSGGDDASDDDRAFYSGQYEAARANVAQREGTGVCAVAEALKTNILGLDRERPMTFESYRSDPWDQGDVISHVAFAESLVALLNTEHGSPVPQLVDLETRWRSGVRFPLDVKGWDLDDDDVSEILALLDDTLETVETALSLADCDDVPTTGAGTAASRGPLPAPPGITIDRTKRHTATIETTEGRIVIALDAANAPASVNNFVYLARAGFYDGLLVNRAVRDFLIQTGGPDNTTSGDAGYQIPVEPPSGDYAVGSVGWGGRVSNPDNTAGSQFFVITGSRFTDLSRTYGYLGTVTSGLDVAQRIEGYAPASGEGKPTRDVTITKVTITVA